MGDNSTDNASSSAGVAAGWRARKKQRTRDALIVAAVRLISAQGYDETTVAQIAAAADVSPRTFFSYFPGKEDVLFADSQQRVDDILAAVARRQRGESVAQTLLRALDETIICRAVAVDLTSDLAARRVRLVLNAPVLQAGALRRIFDAQQQLTRALLDAFPGELSADDAAACVGALVGALVNATLPALAAGSTADGLLAAIRRAVHIAVHGIGSPALPAARPAARRPAR